MILRFNCTIFLSPIHVFIFIDSSMMMIEADVVIGRLYGENDSVAKRPIMAHPPATESDISLSDFVNNIIAVCIISKKLSKGP